MASVADLLRDLAGQCSLAGDSEGLLAQALPSLLEISDAQAVMILRGSGDERTVVEHAGLSLESKAVTGLPIESSQRLVQVDVPPTWLAEGIARVCLRRLPDDAGTMLFAWGAHADVPTSSVEAALAVIDAALARLRAEHELSDLIARVDSAQQLANMGDYDWHIASDTNRWSDQLYRIYGHEPQSFNASYERFMSHIHPDDRERIQSVHQQAYASGEPYEMLERILRPDGEVRYLASNGQVIQDANGTPVRMRGTCIDITDRVLAEQEREHIAERFRSLVESVPDAIMVIDTGGEIVQANGHAVDMLGGDPLGRTFAEVLVLPEGTDWGLGVHATALDGRPLTLDVTIAKLSLVADKGLCAAFLHDATARLESEALAATLREAQVRRRQALEINDNVVQGLTAAILSIRRGNLAGATSYLERTLTSARDLMNDWLDPLQGEDLEPGDLVRAVPSRIEGAPAPRRQFGDPPFIEGERHRIVVVDDNDDVRGLLREQIEAIGEYAVVGEAGDGEEAVRVVHSLQPDVVLLDLSMPRMDGLEALPLILEAVPDVQVIVLSGFAQSSVAEKVLAAGAARYVEKGLQMDLPGVIADVLRSRQGSEGMRPGHPN